MECAICFDIIDEDDKVWTHCVHIAHLRCIQSWAKAFMRENNTRWFPCIICKEQFKDFPTSSCFCGNQKNSDKQSCGSPCGKQLRNCDHSCETICHPNICPPCDQLVNTDCFCGKNKLQVQCSDAERSCDQTCGKVAYCGRHACEQPCHSGPCTCDVMSDHECYCGNLHRMMKCWTEMDVDETKPNVLASFSCTSLCNKTLNCTNHKCKKVCHKGDCGPCEIEAARRFCACTKTQISEQEYSQRSCLNELFTCSNTCDKLLRCGEHFCKQPCHTGPCPQECDADVLVPCPCGSIVTKLPCYDSNIIIPCENQCEHFHSCLRHKCKQLCCQLEVISLSRDSGSITYHNNQRCTILCGKQLPNCKHKCNSICHSGNCPPCDVTSDKKLYCECRRTVVYPPIYCHTKLPKCPYPCSREKLCGHVATHRCHASGECPNCVQLVEKQCACGQEQVLSLCSRKNVHCGRICGKTLPCGHACDQFCHAGECVNIKQVNSKDNEDCSQGETDNVTVCKQECGKLRECGHICKQICHPDQSCSTLSCLLEVMAYCKCKTTKKILTCNEIGQQDKPQQIACDYSVCKHPHPKILVLLQIMYPTAVQSVEKLLARIISAENQSYFILNPCHPIICEILSALAVFYRVIVNIQPFGKQISQPTIEKTSRSRIPELLLSSISQNEDLFRFGLFFNDVTTTLRNRMKHEMNMNMLESEFAVFEINNNCCLCFFRREQDKSHVFLKGGYLYNVEEMPNEREVQQSFGLQENKKVKQRTKTRAYRPKVVVVEQFLLQNSFLPLKR